MKINTEYLNDILNILIKHFEYSIADIKSYEELTSKEKEIISIEMWNKIINNNENTNN